LIFGLQRRARRVGRTSDAGALDADGGPRSTTPGSRGGPEGRLAAVVRHRTEQARRQGPLRGRGERNPAPGTWRTKTKLRDGPDRAGPLVKVRVRVG